MDTGNHPDPFQDAMSHGVQRAVQVASSVMTGAQVYVYLQRTQARAVAERDERARRALGAQIRADRDAARAGWTPGLDAGWLRQADVFQAARTWSAAMPYADRSVPWYEPTAATAMRKCEERLRELHPNAMARYDRLRSDGMGPAEAMREAAHLFAGPPRAHDAPYAPQPVLDAGNGQNLIWTAAGPGPGPGASDGLAGADAQVRRGRQIVEALQTRARTQGRDPLGEAEQRTVLETVTNLPADVIDRVVHPSTATRLARTGQGHAAATAGAATARTAPAARPWERDFPLPIDDVVADAGSASQVAASSPAAAPARGKPQARRGGPRP
jgi:hypothetical protein